MYLLCMNLKILLQFLILLDSYYACSEQKIANLYYYFCVKFHYSTCINV